MNLQKFLTDRSVRYEPLIHEPAYDAQHLAQAVHVSGDDVAKSVLLRVDGEYVLAVCQATHQLDLPKAAAALGAKKVELATELEIQDKFPDCEVGAILPFGSHYGLPTLVDESLTHDDEIVVAGNNLEEAFRIHYADYAELEQPRVAAFTRHA
jgi:Ala-tRNA(Pro) deacylase